jgi:hypothetical protein
MVGFSVGISNGSDLWEVYSASFESDALLTLPEHVSGTFHIATKSLIRSLSNHFMVY